MKQLIRCLRHAWWDVRDTERALPEDAAERLAQRIAASEQHHSGEVRICVEAALPPAMAWQIGSTDAGLQTTTRERATQWFGQLRIWDTEHNNGVLIYLLLAERAIEVVADRGLSQQVPQATWTAIVERLGKHLRQGAFEDGLTQALEEVSALLVQHHPLDRDAPNPDELPNLVVRV
jgi:uncharacterized membrane protein